MNRGGSRRGRFAGGALNPVGGATTESVAVQLSHCRVSSWVGGAPGSFGSSSSSIKEAHLGGLEGKGVVNEKDVCVKWQCSEERILGVVCRSLGVGLLVFVPQQTEPIGGKESFGFTVILPKSKMGLEVVAYGPIATDEGTARKEAAELMMHRVLAATTERLRMLKVECGEQRKLLGMG